MLFFFIAVLAGVLTVLAPCILPLLPVVIGTSTDSDHGRHISRRSVVVIASLSVSVFVFTLLLKVTTLFITIPQSFWAYFSGTIIMLMGLLLLFPGLLARIPGIGKLQRSSNELVGTGYQKHSPTGDMLIGAALGPVFTTCSPTYLFIIATVLPASLTTGVVYLLGFILGLAFALLLIAYFGQKLINGLVARMSTAETVKQVFAGLIILVGIAIFTGYDKKLETAILDSGYGATINFENELIEQFGDEVPARDNAATPSDAGEPIGPATGAPAAAPSTQSSGGEAAVAVPRHLKRAFPDTDWSQASPKIENAVSGGPGKDGIPAIDDPTFESILEFRRDDSVPAIFIESGDSVKVYPYNILNWHEIVNDTVDGVPVAITFCPLCGSAIAFERTVDGEVTTFGVSGSLLESNMIMYDRTTESLWQQSTGEALAGEYFGRQLELVSMQLSTVGEIKREYPGAQILSEDTGYFRQYGRDPYAGYTENNRFVFDPGNLDDRFPAKELFLAFRAGENVVAVRQSHFADQTKTIMADGETYEISRSNGEFAVTDPAGNVVPFYFEMWFSLALQNGESLVVVE